MYDAGVVLHLALVSSSAFVKFDFIVLWIQPFIEATNIPKIDKKFLKTITKSQK